jgi:hypothetical protein
MHILVINFNAETTPDQFNDLVKEDAPIFAAIDGLIHKNFIFNHEKKTYGGVYMFESKSALNAYLDSDIYKSIIENPDWSNHLIRHYEVHSEASEIQNMIKKGAA